MEQKRLRVLIASYNTALQGNKGLPQDLVEWVTPALSPTHDLPAEDQVPPDFVAVGFQELLPLQLGCEFSNMTCSVLSTRDALIRQQLEKNLSIDSTEPQKYSLIAQHARVGIALLIYAREETVAGRVRDVQIRGVGCGQLGMGNKGAIGVRFRLSAEDGIGEGEIFTFLTCHLAAHTYNLPQRIRDYQTIVSSLLFSPSAHSTGPSQIYATTHLFVFGDLNYRLSQAPDPVQLLTAGGREQLREVDQLWMSREAGRTLHGLQEGEFWRFRPTYKYIMGSLEQYHGKRTPSWTDRILFATHDTIPIKPLLYTSIQSYTTSDHKPIMALLLLPPETHDARPPLIDDRVPYPVNKNAWLRIALGTTLDRTVGYAWCVLWLTGGGRTSVGLLAVLAILGVTLWWFGAFSR
ncbi:inositol polyphosphate phosphatase [Dacryopinax primogenitus]|uniref:Inositol polyphosphate phosphatase n=1 Tax=Dacryopinax primogenitus (strain DJM 731) TaxID=1858805 RepID=M5G4Y7_DACPD|nr:inositol polyphosphate phosphatase [Dacryopinax primogenitus]EJU05331.1 inositol polyphosphate phosphatase [Dacryopinax primogenitus]